MKISYRNYPILEKIRNKDLSGFAIMPDDKEFFDEKIEKYLTKWDKHSDAFNSQIVYVTKPFWDAVKTNYEKLNSVFEDIVKTDTFKISGTYIVPFDTVISVDIDIDEKNGKLLIAFYVYSKSSHAGMCYIYDDHEFLWISNFYKNIDNELMKNKQYVSFIFNYIKGICNLEIFKKYANVETKYIPPNKRVKDINCKYVNDTKTGITILDSKWFTTLVKSDAFTVHGHFRLQPCGEGMKDRKLIWINDFMKSGYTATARKLANV